MQVYTKFITLATFAASIVLASTVAAITLTAHQASASTFIPCSECAKFFSPGHVKKSTEGPSKSTEVFAPGKVAQITNTNASVVAPGNVK